MGRSEEMLEVGQTFSVLPPLPVPTFLEIVKAVPKLFLEDIYSLFTFDPMQNLHLCRTETVKNSVVGYTDRKGLFTQEGGSATGGRTF